MKRWPNGLTVIRDCFEKEDTYFETAVPADGPRLLVNFSGDFGTSPFFWQPSGKHSACLCLNATPILFRCL
jgi:hypothetical protein